MNLNINVPFSSDQFLCCIYTILLYSLQHTVLYEHLNGSNHLEDLSIDRRVKPNWISGSMTEETGIEEYRSEQPQMAGSSKTGKEQSGSINSKKVASQEALCSMQLVG